MPGAPAMNCSIRRAGTRVGWWVKGSSPQPGVDTLERSSRFLGLYAGGRDLPTGTTCRVGGRSFRPGERRHTVGTTKGKSGPAATVAEAQRRGRVLEWATIGWNT